MAGTDGNSPLLCLTVQTWKLEAWSVPRPPATKEKRTSLPLKVHLAPALFSFGHQAKTILFTQIIC